MQWIRLHKEILTQQLKDRGIAYDVDALLEKDASCRRMIGQLQEVQQERNLLAKQRGREVQQGIERCNDDHNTLRDREHSLSETLQTWCEERDHMLSLLPNTLHDDVPRGLTEENNKEIIRYGNPTQETWYKDHVTLGGSLIDFTQASHVSGQRFVYLRGEIARLERALGQWMLDTHVEDFGFTEMTTPYLVKRDAVYGAGQLPKFEEDLFQTTDNRFLISTGEVSLVNWAAQRTFSPQELPLRLTALTPCFRAEVGSAGRDHHGLMRHHQFHKVELVVVCLPEETDKHHESITNQAETLLQRLGLPYRKVLLCSGDMGIVSEKTYDLEVWVPSENRYREIASCSQCGTYQARRLGIKGKIGQEKPFFLSTLNGSGLPTGRTLLAIMENYQQKDGSVRIPEVLVPYMGGKKVILGHDPCV